MIDIKGYEGKYFVKRDGTIIRYVKKRKTYKQIKPMKVGKYLCVDLGLNGVIKRHLIHRLVAIAFVSNPENKPEVNHIDGNKYNNSVNNLEWNTKSENQKHSIRTGLRSAKGTKNSQSKLDEINVLKIFFSDLEYKKLSNIYNVSLSTIYDIKNKRSWLHLTDNV